MLICKYRTYVKWNSLLFHYLHFGISNYAIIVQHLNEKFKILISFHSWLAPTFHLNIQLWISWFRRSLDWEIIKSKYLPWRRIMKGGAIIAGENRMSKLREISNILLCISNWIIEYGFCVCVCVLQSEGLVMQLRHMMI